MITVIAVKTLFNTDWDGTPVPDDVAEDDLPTTYHGPFDTIEEAIFWLEEIYPDGDTDVYDQDAGEFEVEPQWLNDPASLYPEKVS